MFPTVEGNSSFYGIPSDATVSSWIEKSIPGFRFVFKFPGSISHDAMLVNCETDLEMWLRRLEPLHVANRLGPTFLQLGPQFSARYSEQLERFLKRLPSEMGWGVEARHLDWFDQAENESWLDDLLCSLGINRVIFDAEALFASPPNDEFEIESQQRKPRSPVRTTVTATQPVVRLIGRNQIELVDDQLQKWAAIVAGWIKDGLRPYVFLHAPDDRHAPALARRFDTFLNQRTTECNPLPKLPSNRQRTLF